MRLVAALTLLCLFLASSASAIVIRHDRSDDLYLTSNANFPMVCRIGAGMGTLVAPEWVVTAAHVAEQVVGGGEVLLGERTVPVAKVFLHPSYAVPGEHRDLALIKLAEPVTDITPAVLYGRDDERGQPVLFVGDGQTGTGLTGPHPGERILRAAQNTVAEVEPGWINMIFDAPPAGDDLEGISGPGDSGGPALLDRDGVRYVIGVSAFNDGGALCAYGTKEHYGRISDERKWLDGVMNGTVTASSERRLLRHTTDASGQATVSSEAAETTTISPAMKTAVRQIANALSKAINAGDEEAFNRLMSRGYVAREGESSLGSLFNFIVDSHKIHGDIISMHPLTDEAISIPGSDAPMVAVVWHFADGMSGYYGITLDDHDLIADFSLFVRRGICGDGKDCPLAVPLAGENEAGRFHYGPHPVGFETIATSDQARRYKVAGSDAYGARPMLFGVWYPASGKSSGAALTPAYLAALGATAETQAEIDTGSLGGDANGADLDPLVPSYRSRLRAGREEGRFPLVLYASAQGSSGFGNALLCELLASHGFIVATVASKGAYSRDMPFNAQGAEAQFRDLEFVYGALGDYPNLEHDNVSVFGFSFGGLNMIPFAERHRGVRAMVSLDGSIPQGLPMVEAYDFLDLGELRTPLLAFIGDKAEIEDFARYLEQTPLADADLFTTADLIHYDFSSWNLMVSPRPPAVRETYRAMADMTIAFIAQHARGGHDYDELRETCPQAMFPSSQFRPAQGEPRVSRDEFIHFVRTEGLDAGLAVYDETKRDFPGYRLFEYGAFRDIGYQFMLQEDYPAAVKAFRVLFDAYPDEADSHRRLGEALMMAGQDEEARDYLTRGLAIDPDSPALLDILRRLGQEE